jgi:4-amino-4-deoxy-L-arabinose transferase-like glycosyltransferase
MEKPESAARRAFLIAWGLLAVAKLALTLSLQPLGDEAFYWWESRHLALAYSDLPGATAWLVALGTSLGGDSLIGLRWPFLLLGLLLPWQVAWLARQGGDHRAAWLAGSLAVAMPLMAVLGLMALPDVPLAVATLLCLQGAMGLLRRVSVSALLLLGAGLALGALSHYRFAIVIPALGLGLLLAGALPRLCRSAGFWAALAVGALAWLPLVLFNLRHAGAGLSFHLVDRHPWQLHEGGLLQPLVQAAVVSPLLYALLLGMLLLAWQQWRERGSGPAGFVFGFAALPVLGFWLLAFVADSERSSFHWVLPAYLVLLGPAAAWLGSHPGFRRATLATAFASTALAFTWLAAAALPALDQRLAGGKWFLDNLAGWAEAAQVVQRQARALPPQGWIVADNFMLAAQLGFALGDQDRVMSLDHPLNAKHGRALQLRLWQRDGQALDALPPGTPLLFAVEQTATKPNAQPAWQRQWCERFGALEPFGALSLYEGRKRFLFYRAETGRLAPSQCARPAMARFYDLAAEQVVVGPLELRGWAIKDGVGLDALEITLDGRPLAEARLGQPAPHVQAGWPDSDDPRHPDVGFAAEVDLSGVAPGRYRLGIRVLRDGRAEEAHTLPVRVAAPGAEPESGR